MDKETQDFQAKIAIPCHFWTFIEHNEDPKGFVEAYHDKTSQAKVVLIQECGYYVYTS